MLNDVTRQAFDPEVYQAVIWACVYACLPAGLYWAAWSASEYKLIPRPWHHRLVGSLARMAGVLSLVALVRHLGWPIVQPTMTLLFHTNDAPALFLCHFAISTAVAAFALREPTTLFWGLAGNMSLYMAMCSPLVADVFPWQIAAMGIVFWEMGATHVVRPKLTTCVHALFCKCSPRAASIATGLQ